MKNWLKATIIILAVLVIAFVLTSNRRIILPINPLVSMTTPASDSLSAVSGSAESASPYAIKTQTRSNTLLPPLEPGGLADLDKVTRTDNRLIVRNGQFSIVSEDVEQSVNTFRDAVTAAGGTINNLRITRSPAGIPQGQVTARVPVENFDQTVEAARQSGLRVADENITGQDVTEQYVDTEARLRSLRASEEQFLKILEQAEKIEEVLSVQQQLERVRIQIEQSQAQMQYLERSAKLSTITINFAADEEALPVINPVTRWRPLLEVKEATQALLRTTQRFGNLLIWIAIFSPLWLPLLLIAWYLARRKTTP